MIVDHHGSNPSVIVDHHGCGRGRGEVHYGAWEVVVLEWYKMFVDLLLGISVTIDVVFAAVVRSVLN